MALQGESGKSAENSAVQGGGAEAEKLAGPISRTDGLREAFQKVIWTTSQRATLRVISRDVRGLIGIAEGRCITGARTTDGKTGLSALKEMLCLRQGMFAFLPESQQTSDLEQSLALDIKQLLKWRAGDSVPEGVDGELLLLLNECETESQSQVPPIPGAESLSAVPVAGSDGDPVSQSAAGDAAGEMPFLMDWGDAPPVSPEGSVSKLAPVLRKVTGAMSLERTATPAEEVRTEHPVARAPAQEADAPPGADGLYGTAETQIPAAGTETGAAGLYGTAETQIPAAGTETGAAGLYTSADLDAIGSPGKEVATGNSDRVALDSIAAPKISGSREMPRSGSGQEQVFADIEKSMGFAPESPAPKTSGSGGRESAASGSSPPSRYSQELNKLVKATGQQVKPSRQYLAAETPYKPAREVSLAQAGVRGLLPTVVVSVGLLIAAIIFTNQMVSEGLIKQSYSLGMEFYKGGQKELARKKFDDIVRARPKDGEGYFFRGLASAELNEYDLAIEDYDAAIKLQPGHVASYTGRALAYIKLRDFRRAIADCDAALKLKKDYVDAYRLKAIAEAKDGRFSQAVQDCDKFIALSPGKGLSEVLTVRGFAKFKLGKVRDAMENFEAAIKYAPKDGSVYANVAQCHYLLHDYAGTIALCDQALHWSPRHVGALILRGRCRAQSADYKKALADFNKAVTVDPSPESYRSRADVYLSLKNYSAAAADLEEVIRLSPGDKAARSSLEQAWVHVKQAPSRTTPFVESQAKAIVAVTGSSDDLIRRGYQLLRSGSNGEAVVVLSAAVKADPQSVLARRYLAHALAQSGSVGGAVQQFQVLSGLGALEAADQLAYGKVLVSGRKFAQAIQIYSRLLSSDPGNSAARKGLIQAYIASGAQTEAVSACNEGLRNARSPQELSVYQGLLKSAQRGKAGSGEDKAH